MRSGGLSNKKEMNVIAPVVFDLHIRGRASTAFTQSCLLKNRNMFYKIGNRGEGGGRQAVEHVLQRCLAEGRWSIIISISPECWRSVTLISDRDANKISQRNGKKKTTATYSLQKDLDLLAAAIWNIEGKAWKCPTSRKTNEVKKAARGIFQEKILPSHHPKLKG